MSTFVLIHGAWLGAWNWNKLTPLLEQAGHRVITFDLPGHGEDHTPVATISLQSYVDRVTQVLDQQPEPVILVAHSMGTDALGQGCLTYSTETDVYGDTVPTSSFAGHRTCIVLCSS